MKRIFRLLPLILGLMIPLAVQAQLTGVVLDEKGEPLPFASVYVRNSTNGTAANAEGEFRLLLEKGRHEVVFQYIGYRQKVETVTIADRPVRLRVRLEPTDLEISEVVITTEDPAYGIMRKVIEKRNYYKNRVPAYSCDAYIKGFYKLLDAPKKILGQDVGDMDGMLDSNRSGVVYLSESVSQVFVQARPPRSKEVMISSKVSGRDRGFSLNRATFTDFNLYDEHLQIERTLLSPLADNAFQYYRFRLAGRYRDENGYDIYQIEVKPKRAEDPAFHGLLFVVDNWYNLAGADLAITGNVIQQPALDTLRIRQSFVPVSQPDTWCLLNQLTSFKFGVFGFRVGGFFNSVFSNYNVEPAFPEDFFTRETFRIEPDANKRDTSYWETVRPVPLTPEEVRDYVRKDSIALIRESKAYKDSMDRRANRFKPGNLITGYTWRNSYKKTSVSYPAAPQWIQFNTVQGWLLNVQPEYSRYDGDYRSRFWRAEGTLNYGLSEQRLRYGLKAARRMEAVHYRTVEAEGGVLTEQFNQKRPIGPLTNTIYSLFLERNYLKLYEKAYGRLGWSQRFPGLTVGGTLEFSERRPLVNHSDQTWYKGEDRAYTPNAPVLSRDPAEPFFDKHRAFLLGVELRFRPRETYSTYPDFRIYHGSDWPEFRVSYRKAVPGIAGSVVNYDLIQAGIFRNDLSLGLAGFTDLNLRGGLFLNRRRVEFMDMYHPVGNQTILARPAEYGQSFFLLPYYGYGTDRAFVEAHLQHQLDGWLLDKIPLIRRLNWKEVFGAGIYYSDRPVVEQSGQNPLPYWEVNAGLKNIGFSLVRPLRIDVAAGFFGREHYRTSIVLGLTL